MTQTSAPTAPPPNRARPLGISLKADRRDWITQTAQTQGITVSELIRRCIDSARKNPKSIGL